MKKIELGLIKGRHEMPVSDYIFEEIKDVTNTAWIELLAIEKLLKLFPEVSKSSEDPASYVLQDYADVGYFNYRGELVLYVTGLTVALIAVINACTTLGIRVEVMHFNSETQSYFSQKIIW